jgi:hypothetical protein
MAKGKEYFAVHNENEYTSLGRRKREAEKKLKKLRTEEFPKKFDFIQI